MVKRERVPWGDANGAPLSGYEPGLTHPACKGFPGSK